MSTARRRTRWALAAAVIALAVLHQDLWLWDDRSLVLGFLPVGLAYHAAYSLVAAALWALAVRFAWPSHVEAWADGARHETGHEMGHESGHESGDGRP